MALCIPGMALAQQLDPQFAPSFSDTVSAIAFQPDGTVVVAGEFQAVNGQDRYTLARFSPEGALLSAFPMPNNKVLALAVQADGRIVIGGKFSTVGGTSRSHVARLLADGTSIFRR